MKPPSRKRKRPWRGSDEEFYFKKVKVEPGVKTPPKQKVLKKSSPMKTATKRKSQSPVKKKDGQNPSKKKSSLPHKKLAMKKTSPKKSPSLAKKSGMKKTVKQSKSIQKSPARKKITKKKAGSKGPTGPPQKKIKSTKSVSSKPSPVKKSSTRDVKKARQVTPRGRVTKKGQLKEPVRRTSRAVAKQEQAPEDGGIEQETTVKIEDVKVKEQPAVEDSSMDLNGSKGNSVSEGKSGKFVGAHVLIENGLDKAVFSAQDIGAKAFALFLRAQHKWVSKPMDEAVAERFRENCKKHGFSPHLIIPHGSYLMNCGSPDKEVLEKSRAALVEDLSRCEKLGLTRFNFHPGSSCGEISVEECLDNIGDSINYAHEKTTGVMTVVENMSCQGNTVGGKFEELRGIIDRVKDKSRIGVCFDTCHAFAAGHDISSEEGYEKVMTEFDRVVGFQYLKAVHLNDSMGDLGYHQDRHENIGKGKIGIKGFYHLMNDPRFDNIPLILETPKGFGHDKEIKILYSLLEDKQ